MDCRGPGVFGTQGRALLAAIAVEQRQPWWPTLPGAVGLVGWVGHKSCTAFDTFQPIALGCRGGSRVRWHVDAGRWSTGLLSQSSHCAPITRCCIAASGGQPGAALSSSLLFSCFAFTANGLWLHLVCAVVVTDLHGTHDDAYHRPADGRSGAGALLRSFL
jgi:hypothetical protein